ncbi:hypothetical protein RYX36_013314 [Vicia faba]
MLAPDIFISDWYRFCHHVLSFQFHHSSLYQSASRVVGVYHIFRVFELRSIHDVCVEVLVKGHVEDRVSVILLSWLLLAVKSYMRPFVFTRVLAMAANYNSSVMTVLFFWEGLFFPPKLWIFSSLGFIYSELLIVTSLLYYVIILQFALCTEMLVLYL